MPAQTDPDYRAHPPLIFYYATAANRKPLTPQQEAEIDRMIRANPDLVLNPPPETPIQREATLNALLGRPLTPAQLEAITIS
jgi:hypothetical protein